MVSIVTCPAIRTPELFAAKAGELSHFVTCHAIASDPYVEFSALITSNLIRVRSSSRVWYFEARFNAQLTSQILGALGRENIVSQPRFYAFSDYLFGMQELAYNPRFSRPQAPSHSTLGLTH